MENHDRQHDHHQSLDCFSRRGQGHEGRSDNNLHSDKLAVALKSSGIVMAVHYFSKSIKDANVPDSDICILR